MIRIPDVIVMSGLPASGKTGPADYFASAGYEKYVCSDEVRKATQNDPEVKAIADSGAMWSDELVNRVMRKLMLSSGQQLQLGHCLDGYPRSEGQFNCLMEIARQYKRIISVVWVDVPVSVARERAATRRQEMIDAGLEPRRDDDPVVHDRRIVEYDMYGPLTLGLFRSAGVPVHRIDGTKTKQEVIDTARACIFSFDHAA